MIKNKTTGCWTSNLVQTLQHLCYVQEGEFSIPFPVQNSSVGARVDILNLEEQPEDSGANLILSLRPMAVTDDEYSSTLHEETASKPQRLQKLRKL